MAKAKPKAPATQPAAKVDVQPSIFASVAFLKIHDFGRRPVVEQARLRAQLEAVVAVALQDLEERQRIVLDAADGIALVILDDPRATLALAERTLAAGAAGLPLSVGLNHGPMKPAGKGKHEGLAGDGIAVAAGIAELAGAGKLLATREFRGALEDAAPGSEAGLANAGTHTDSSLRAHDLYRAEPRAGARRRLRYAVATTVAIVGLVGAGIGYRGSIEGFDRYAARMKTQAVDVVERLRAEAPPPAPPPPAAKRRSR